MFTHLVSKNQAPRALNLSTTFARGGMVVMACLVFAFAACSGDTVSSPADGDVTLKGRVSHPPDSQLKTLGGAAAIDAVAALAYQVLPGGTLVLIGEGAVQSDGSYQMSLPAGLTAVVIQAVDAAGAVVASALLETTGNGNGTTTCTPMDSESSVEAEVYLAILGAGIPAETIDIIDIRIRIDDELASAVQAIFASQGDAEYEIGALAEAIAAAQATELQVLDGAGIATTQSALFMAEMQASVLLSHALHTGEDPQAAYEVFFASIAEAIAIIGVDSETQYDCATTSSAAFLTVLYERLNVIGARADTLLDAASCAAAGLVAHALAVVLNVLFVVEGAVDVVLVALADALAQLRADLATATTSEAAAAAFAALSAALVGENSVSGSILDTHLQWPLTTEALADTALLTALTAGNELGDALSLGVIATLTSSEGFADPILIAEAVTSTCATHQSVIDTAVDLNQITFGNDTGLIKTLLGIATGGFHMTSP